MRIDEFSAPADIDGTLDVTERTRFLTFGFDIELTTILELFFSEKILLKSHMKLIQELASEILLEKFIGSEVITKQVLGSTIVEGENDGQNF